MRRCTRSHRPGRCPTASGPRRSRGTSSRATRLCRTAEISGRAVPGRDHGGGIDEARRRWGGARADWIDLSTGINPVPYPFGAIPFEAWTALPDREALDRLLDAARRFWSVPEGAAILAAPGASALIARMPELMAPDTVRIDAPTYNEHAASFERAKWRRADAAGPPAVRVVVHPNNPTGSFWDETGAGTELTIIDESFCDVAPGRSLVARTAAPGTVVLKSFGKFWGLAGARLGFAIAEPSLIADLAERLGPWPVSGPALDIGAQALADTAWAGETRARLDRDAARLDALMQMQGGRPVGGTSLFRLYRLSKAMELRDRLARAYIWTRAFSYDPTWLRLGLPGTVDAWQRLERALAEPPQTS